MHRMKSLAATETGRRSGEMGRTVYAAVLAVVMTVTALPVMASTSPEKEKIDSRIQQTQQELDTGKEKQNQLIGEIRDVNHQMELLQEQISELDRQIKDREQEIALAEEQLEVKKEEIGKQNEALDTRLRVMYKRGDTGMLEVLLGSSDISELISNADMLRKLYRNDLRVLKSLKQQYEAIASQVEQLKELRAGLESQQEEQKEHENRLSQKIEELENLEKKVAQDNEALEAQLDELNREAEKITEELRQKEIAASTSSESSYDGGSMLWPVPTYSKISSKYGYRMHPILHVSKMHTGLDISAASGEQILAASDGKVILSAVKGGYGNCVMIDHGGGIVTLYGHCSRLLVSSGQSVVRGQVIALVGSTGMSTGPHCHFEVRVNGATTDPLNYLDLKGKE